jgi:hypothetical protein
MNVARGCVYLEAMPAQDMVVTDRESCGLRHGRLAAHRPNRAVTDVWSSILQKHVMSANNLLDEIADDCSGTL